MYKPEYQIEEVKHFVVLRACRRTAIDGCHRNAGHQGKKRTESFLIDSGGLESSKMSAEQSRTVDSVSFMEGGRKSPNGPNDGHCPPPAGSSRLHFI